MKFPLTRSPLGPIALPPQRVTELKDKADALLDETLDATTRLFDTENGCVNELVWKRVKTFDGSITMYRERKDNKSASSASPPSFLVTGTVCCGLDDLMYGLSSSTAEAQRARSSYTHEGIVDCQVLHEVHAPTKKNPFHHLNLQWIAMRTSGLPLLQPRDYVVLDSASVITLSPATHRIGYSIRHSVSLEQAPSLGHLKIARGVMSVCAIYRERSSGEVQIYIQMSFDPRTTSSSLGAFLSIATAFNHTQTVARALHCAQMKKLAMAVLVHERQGDKSSFTEDELASSQCNADSNGVVAKCSTRNGCGSCDQPLGQFTPTEGTDTSSCLLCHRVLCRSCRVRKDLSFTERYNRVHRSKATVCSVCISRSIHQCAKKTVITAIASSIRQIM